MTSNITNNGLKVNVIKGASIEAINSSALSCLDSKNTAIEKATEASVSASSSSASEAISIAKANEASTSASSSSMQASIATAQAVIATTKANEASASASSAATSASSAATSATSASTNASSASSSATSASDSATSALTSRNEALTFRNEAEGFANDAATSATNAGISETNCATSELNASNSASAAATSESNASTSETNAANSASSAASSASSAGSSATSASNSAASALSSANTATSAKTYIENYVIPTEATYSKENIDTKINALAPYSGYTQVSKKLDNFVFQTSSSFLNKVADKNRFVKFGDKVVDTYGPELVTNGDFSDGTTGWSGIDGQPWYIEDGVLKRIVSADSQEITQSVTTNKMSKITVSVKNHNSKGTAIFRINGGANDIGITSSTSVSTTKASDTAVINNGVLTIIIASPISSIGFRSYSSTVYCEFDNISVREIKTADFTNTVPDVAEVITNGSNTTSVSVNAGEYVVDGSELVTNGTFDSDISGWSIGSGTTTEVINGEVKVTAGSVYGIYKELSGLIIGQKYILRGSGRVSVGGDVRLRFYPDTFNVGTYIDSNVVTSTSNKEMSLTFIAESTSPVIYLRCSATDIVGYFDNISVKRVSDTFRATRDTADMYDVVGSGTNNISFTQNKTVVKYEGGALGGTVGHYYLRLGGTTLNYPNSSLDYTNIDWQDLGTADSMSLSNPYFEDRTEIGVTNQQLSYHAYNTLTNSYEGIKTETLFSDVSKEDLLDNPTWLARNGFSKVSDFLYSKGSYLVLPIGIWQSLNKGAYHPVFNMAGTRPFKAVTTGYALYWYGRDAAQLSGTLPLLNGVNSCFIATNLRLDIGDVLHSNSYNWRPDSKFYDITYSDQFIDVREYAKVLTPYEVDLLRDDKEENGVEEATVTKKYDYDLRPAPTAVGISKTSSFDGYDYREDKLYIVANGIGFIVEKADMLFVAPNTTISNTYSRFAELRSALIASGISEYTWGKATASASVSTKPILTSNTKLSIDLIGSPSVYPQILKDRLASGVGVVGINPLLVNQNGESQITDGASREYIVSKKCLTYFNNQYVLSGQTKINNSISWKIYLEGVTNSRTIADNLEYNLINYTSKNLPYVQTTPKPVIEVEPKVTASNSHSIYKGALVGNQVAGKIQVGNGANGYESKVLENEVGSYYHFKKSSGISWTGIDGNWRNSRIYLDIIGNETDAPRGVGVYEFRGSYFGTVSNVTVTKLTLTEANSWFYIGKEIQPTHPTIALDNANSPASKWFETLEEGNNGVLAGVYGEELVYNSGTTSFDGDDDTFEQLTNGTITDLNGNKARTFHGSIALNGKVK